MMPNDLKNTDIVSDDVIDQIKQMKVFRDLLVHRYGPLDDKIAYEDIKKGLDDFQNKFHEIKKVM